MEMPTPEQIRQIQMMAGQLESPGNEPDGHRPATYTVRPKQYKKSAPPIFQKSMIMGQEGEKFTRVKVYVRAPTMQFPTVGIFIQLSNAAGSAYARLDNVSELSALAAWLNEVHALIEPRLAPLEAKAAEINTQVEGIRAMESMGLNNNSGWNNDTEDRSSAPELF